MDDTDDYEKQPSLTPDPDLPFLPSAIITIEDTGLSPLWLQDLALKILYFQGYLSGYRVAEELTLPFPGVVDQVLDALKREKLVEIKSSQQVGLGEGTYQYAITGAGITRAREALERSQYAGPAPVPLEVYNDAIVRQSKDRTMINETALRQALNHLVLSDKILERIGPAVNSGTSIFLYGPPGDGDYSPRLKAGASRAMPRDCSPNPKMLIAAFWSLSMTRPQAGHA